jgi:alpha-L-fucosidase
MKLLGIYNVQEGYTLWPNAQSWNWNSVDIGPEQDLMKEMMQAFRAKGLRGCAYFSLYEWFNPLYLRK